MQNIKHKEHKYFLAARNDRLCILGDQITTNTWNWMSVGDHMIMLYFFT